MIKKMNKNSNVLPTKYWENKNKTQRYNIGPQRHISSFLSETAVYHYSVFSCLGVLINLLDPPKLLTISTFKIPATPFTVS